MSEETFRSMLESWVGTEITVINPESYRTTALKESLGFQSYQAKIMEVGKDFVKITFTAKKKEQDQEIEQWIRFDMIKRAYIWGGERFLHV